MRMHISIDEINMPHIFISIAIKTTIDNYCQLRHLFWTRLDVQGGTTSHRITWIRIEIKRKLFSSQFNKRMDNIYLITVLYLAINLWLQFSYRSKIIIINIVGTTSKFASQDPNYIFFVEVYRDIRGDVEGAPAHSVLTYFLFVPHFFGLSTENHLWYFGTRKNMETKPKPVIWSF